MGNSQTKEVMALEAETVPTATIVTGDDSYKWPENLYIETREMAAAAFLVYTFGYVLDCARRDGIEGMDVDPHGHVCKHGDTSSRLSRSFTPEEVKKIVTDNRELLEKRFPSNFKDWQLLEQSLDLLQDRVQESGMDRPLTLVEFDDHHQDQEMVYAVAKDDVNKRITIVFRGTDNELAFGTNWWTNLSFSKVPVVVQDKTIRFHGGFYNYIFGTTATTEDAPEKRKYDEILEDIKPLLQANPDYKLFVTGHSLGGAIATIVSFYLACDNDIPKPVTCLSFAAPRVGNVGFRQAVTALEQSKQLRMLRIVNAKDSIPMCPMVNFKHVGLQIRLYENASSYPELSYPKVEESYWNKFVRAYGNSLITSLNVGYDHSDYRERVEQNQAFLQGQDLNELYNNVELTGFSWASES